MKDLDDFLPGILPYAPGCASPTAYFGIRQAAIEFCERTRLWRSEDSFDVTPENCDAIMAPYGAVIHEIEHASFNGQPLKPKSTQWLDDHENGWRLPSYTGNPGYITQLAPGTVMIVPRGEGTLTLHLWLKPSQDCTELPDFLLDEYREVIAMGALGRILLIPNQSFTNVEMGAAFAGMFAAKLDARSTKGTKGQQRAPIRTKASMF